MTMSFFFPRKNITEKTVEKVMTKAQAEKESLSAHSIEQMRFGDLLVLARSYGKPHVFWRESYRPLNDNRYGYVAGWASYIELGYDYSEKQQPAGAWIAKAEETQEADTPEAALRAAIFHYRNYHLRRTAYDVLKEVSNA